MNTPMGMSTSHPWNPRARMYIADFVVKTDDKGRITGGLVLQLQRQGVAADWRLPRPERY